MTRQRSYYGVYAPTRLDADGVRHVITSRDGSTLCGQHADGEQTAPRAWPRHALCAGCVQKYIRGLFDYGKGQGWE